MKWFQREMATGFQKLLTLRLKNTPADEVIEGTLATWIDALSNNRVWNEQRDTPRLQAAFRTLCQYSEAWPSIHEFLNALPAPEPLAALPEPKVSPEVALENIAKIKEMLTKKPIYRSVKDD
ncbi:hypothetical protein [Oligella urethralis]|uniref:hypothetical protein n=1 Tax=Oligella urethralis TaxID=90245 RepID=UPI002889E27A|nr:hypothetical protein [Oligella urethralis]